MKYIISFICAFCILGVKASVNFDCMYSKEIKPFILKVSKIYLTDKEMELIINVKNTSSDTHTINLAADSYIYNAINNTKKVKAKKINSTFWNESKIIWFKGGEEKTIFAWFPILCYNKFNVELGAYLLDGIDLPLDNFYNFFNYCGESWEQYYNARKVTKLTFNNIEEIQRTIQLEVENWQIKGEFESTHAWQTRVNETTRQQHISDLISKYSQQHENEVNQLKQEQIKLAQDYDSYKQSILDKYYELKIKIAQENFIISSFDLKPYDADNETFLVHNNLFGDILLPVPIKDAPSFKQNWAKICKNIKAEFAPNGDDVALNKLVFTNNPNIYTYDSQTVANYAITEINYNFAPVEISEINFADIDIDGISAIPSNISSSIVGLNNQGGLTQNNYIPTRNKIFVSDKSDVDISIPQNSELKNSTTFAVIIANEKYNSVSPVQYAENDGDILSKYLINTVGLPQEHVKIYKNATFGNMVAALKHINNLSLAFGDKLNLILYYAGHGVPNEQTKQCMLLPIDGDATMPETCYDVDRLYDTLGKYNANSIIVIMDACFSGSVRGDGMLIASRSVKIKSNQAEPKGNMVILSASQGNETAFPFEKEQHGMFTYYLLKNLQENKGNVTLGQLSEYLIEQVKRQSVVSNGKLQIPSILVGDSIKDNWKEWKFGR